MKLDHAIGACDVFISKYPDAVVSYSGGVDSELVLYLCRMIKSDILGRMVNTTNEHSATLIHAKNKANIDILLPETTFIKTVEKYGFPILSKKICRQVNDIKHPTDKNQLTVNLYKTGINQRGEFHAGSQLSKKWWKLIDAPFDVTSKCCYYLKEKLLDSFGSPSIIGTMAIDSGWRKDGYLKTGCVDIAGKKCKPISIFTKQDVWDAVKLLGIKYNPIYDDGEHNTGCAFCGMGCQMEKESRYFRLQRREPKRFDQMMNLKNNGVTFREALIFCNIKSLKFLTNRQTTLQF